MRRKLENISNPIWFSIKRKRNIKQKHFGKQLKLPRRSGSGVTLSNVGFILHGVLHQTIMYG